MSTMIDTFENIISLLHPSNYATEVEWEVFGTIISQEIDVIKEKRTIISWR